MKRSFVQRQAGWPGLFIAGSCFIPLAALIVSAPAWMYVRYGSLPQTDAVLYGVKPVIIVLFDPLRGGIGEGRFFETLSVIFRFTSSIRQYIATKTRHANRAATARRKSPRAAEMSAHGLSGVL